MGRTCRTIKGKEEILNDFDGKARKKEKMRKTATYIGECY
jgi:hypothetical protein